MATSAVDHKLVLLDTNGLVYRAFYALPYFTTADGRPTNAVYGFISMLLKVLEEERPDFLGAAVDRPVPTFRHRAYEPYKAHREKMPDDLRPQFAVSREILAAFHIPTLGMDGYEAEDVITAIARRGVAAGFDVLIVSGDLDLLQIVREGVRVMITSRGVTETTIYDEARVRERFGFAPAQLPDYKALKGDTTDNIPGVPGIGEKTAGALVAQFGTVEALLERLDEAPARLRERLRSHADQILQSKTLATVVEAPVEWRWDELRRRPADQERVRALFTDLEFKTLLERLGDRPLEVPAAGVYAEASTGRELLQDVESEAGVFIARGSGHPLWASVSGIAISPSSGKALFLSLADGPADRLAAWLADASVVKVSADVKADLQVLDRLGIPPGGWDFDVAIAAYLLNPGRKTHTLETAAWEYLGWRLDGEEKEPLDLDAPTIACRAADALIRLRPILEEKLRERELLPLFRDIEMPLAAVLADMERTGVRVDVGYLQALSGDLAGRVEGLAQEIYRLAGTDFNISSPKQLQFVLFQKLQLPALKKTKTGLSTDAEVLEYLAGQHEIAAKIVEHRELVKLKSTYVDVLPRLADPRTGRVHTTFNQTLAATGRISSSEPNMQNVPIRTEVGRQIRRAIIPGDGAVLLGVDYSQIDLRVLAHVTEDPTLLDAFGRGDDVHTVTAMEVFGVSREGVTPELRRRAKVIVFGVAYGMSDFGLAAQLGIGRSEAKAYIERYYARYPNVRAYMGRIVEQARRQGFVTTLLNRRRYLTDLFSRNRAVREAAERTAINTPIQGSSADIIKKAMIEIARDVLVRRPDVRMTLQVHDELLFEVPVALAERAAREIQEIMEHTYRLTVPLLTDAKVGPNWRDMEPLAAHSGMIAGGSGPAPDTLPWLESSA